MTNSADPDQLASSLIWIYTVYQDSACHVQQDITKTRLFKYTENLTTKKWNFLDKNSDIFHISAQNIDCGYSLEPPHRLTEAVLTSTHNLCFWAEISKIMYTPVNPSFTI